MLVRPALDCKRRGATLVEMAIVLALVFLGTVAVWATAQTVYEQIEIERASDQTQEIVQNMRNLYNNPAFLLRGNDATFNCDLVKARVYPEAMLPNPQDKTSCQAIDHAWYAVPVTGSITIAAYDLAAAADVPSSSVTGAKSFRIRYEDVPSKICVKFATRDFTADPQQRLQAIRIIGTTTATYLASARELPLNPATIAPLCGTNTVADIDFIYAIR